MDITRIPPIPAYKLIHPDTPSELFDKALFYYDGLSGFLRPILFNESSLSNGEAATFSLKQIISKDSEGNLQLGNPSLIKD